MTVTKFVNNIFIRIILATVFALIISRLSFIFRVSSETITASYFLLFLSFPIFVFGKIRLWYFSLPVVALIFWFGLNEGVWQNALKGGDYTWLTTPFFVLLAGLMLAFSAFDILHSISKKFKLAQFWVILGYSIPFLLSLFYGILSVMMHGSFESSTFDYGLHDQNFFYLSNGIFPPANTIHQFSNLWVDHQHFTQLILAPLFWFGSGFNGYMMMLVTPFILIALPAVFITCALRNLFLTYLHGFWQRFYHLSVIPISLLLFIHPYTQAALKFFFHEKYLANLFAPLTLLFLTYWLRLKKTYWLALSLLATLLWIGVKEDQWLYVIFLWLQVGFWLFLSTRPKITQTLKTYAQATGGVIATCLFHWFAFIPFVRSTNPDVKTIHDKAFKKTTDALKDLFRNWDFVEFFKVMDFFGQWQLHLYQNFFSFDLVGFFFLPFNTSINYAIRLAAGNRNYRLPVFQYGSEVPMYSALGVAFIFFLLFFHKQAIWAGRYIFFALFIYILGFSSLLGFSHLRTYYLIADAGNIHRIYQETNAERQNFEKIIKNIPDGASLVTQKNYVPHLSQRLEISPYPKARRVSYDASGNVDLDTYDYWLLPKKGRKKKPTKSKLKKF